MKHFRIYTAATIVLGLVVGVTGLANADTIMLTGTVRDFNDTHPDFEQGIVSGVTAGIVSSTLGGDDKPVYDNCGGLLNTAPFCGATNGMTAFDQWYNNDAVNMDAPLSITLDNTITVDPNVFTFVDNSFFPIDGQLFGNQARAHNFHFTYEIHTTFTYQGGESFTFTGDDDVWVFINGKLAVDLGGVHPSASGSVDLDTAAATLGISTGNIYSFDLFFAERQTSGSNFRIDTSIELVSTGDIDIDIKPGSFPNGMNICGGGVVPLAFIGNDFDPNDFEVLNVIVGNIAVGIIGKGNRDTCVIEDVTGDFGVDTEQTVANPGGPDLIDDLVCQVPTINLRASGELGSGDVKDENATLEVCVSLDAKPVDGAEDLLLCGTDSVFLTKDCF